MSRAASLPTPNPQPPIPARRWVLGLLLGVALMLAVYAVAANAWWVGDDYNYVVPKGWGQVLNFFNPVGRAVYRPWTWLSWAADWSLFGANPLPWHLTGFLMHAINMVAAALLVRAITGSASVGVIAATLFGLHPAAPETVTWVGGRADVSLALFWLPALALWVCWRRGAGRATWAGALGLAILSVGGKESAITLPLVILWTDLVFGRAWARWPGRRDAGWWRDRTTWLRLLRDHLPFLLITAIYVAIRLGLFLTGQGRLMYGTSEQFGFLSRAPGVITGYLTLALGGWPWVTEVQGWPLAAQLALIAGAGVGGVALVRWLGRTALFAFGWVAITLLLTTQAVASRWFYVPALGVSLLIAWTIGRLWSTARPAGPGGRPGPGWPAVAALALLLVAVGGWSALTLEQNLHWVQSGQEARRLLDQIRALEPDPARPATFYMANPPPTYNGVLLFNSGFGPCINLLYNDWTAIRAYEVHESAAYVQAALADPTLVGANPVFLRYEDGTMVRYPSLRALVDRQNQGLEVGGWGLGVGAVTAIRSPASSAANH